VKQTSSRTRARARAGRAAAQLAVFALAVVLALAGCSGGGSRTDAPAEATGKRLSGHRITIQLPSGWDGRIADRGFPLSGAAIVHVATFSLPPGDDDWGSKARKAVGRNDVLLVLSETLPDPNLPAERARIEPGERRTAVDRYFVASARAFLLHATFGSRPPPRS
jgi:hypothetical protein